MIGFLFFAAMTPAQTNIDFARWVMSNSETRRESEAVAVELELWVSPDGKVEGCHVARFAGTERTARKLCDQSGGKRLTPAQDPRGDASYGVARTTVISAPPRNVQARNDLVRALEASAPTEDVILAGPAGGPIEYYTVLVDPTGTVAGCDATARTPAEHTMAVCGQLAGKARTVRRSKTGAAVAYVERLRVRFSPSPAATTD